MWNTTNNTCKTTINTPASGIIQKSNPKSFFLRMQNDSSLSKIIFSQYPNYEGTKIVVLQTLLMGMDWLLVEVVEEKEL